MSGGRPSAEGRAPSDARRRRTLAIALSLGAHLALLPLLFLAATERPIFSPSDEEFDAIVVSLDPPPLPPPPEPAPSQDPGGSPPETTKTPEKPASPVPVPTPRPTPPPSPRTRAARPAPANVETVVANPLPTPAAFVGVSDAELGGAAVAGGGSGSGLGSGSGTGAGSGSGSGGPCDMVRRIQDALRDDANIRQTAAEAHRTLGRDRALLMWDGDWLQSPGQAGKGLAGVRQAIALEIAFAPPACRRQAMQGYAVISLGDAPGSPRIALGAAHWRWSDLAVRR